MLAQAAKSTSAATPKSVTSGSRYRAAKRRRAESCGFQHERIREEARSPLHRLRQRVLTDAWLIGARGDSGGFDGLTGFQSQQDAHPWLIPRNSASAPD